MRLALPRLLSRAKTVQGTLTVASLSTGQRARIVQMLGCEEQREQLKALGLEPGVEVQICRAGSPCVLGVGFACGGTCRIGVGRHMARHIVVECTRERDALAAQGC